MAFMFRATHVLQWPVQNVAISQEGANRKNRSQFGLESATRLHEVGIASNRGSARRGEYVPGPCTHRPSHHGSQLLQKWLAQPARGGGPQGVTGDWGEVVTR